MRGVCVTVGDKSFTACPKKKIKNCAGDVLKLLPYSAVLSCHPYTLCLSALLPLTFLFVSFLLLKTSAIWVKIFCLFLQSAEYNIGIPIQPYGDNYGNNISNLNIRNFILLIYAIKLANFFSFFFFPLHLMALWSYHKQ